MAEQEEAVATKTTNRRTQSGIGRHSNGEIHFCQVNLISNNFKCLYLWSEGGRGGTCILIIHIMSYNEEYYTNTFRTFGQSLLFLITEKVSKILVSLTRSM